MQCLNFQRERKLRVNSTLRSMLSENVLKPEHLIKPLFIHLENSCELLPQLPNSMVFSLNGLLSHIEYLMKKGIRGVNLYPKIPTVEKDNLATQALNPEGVIPQAIKLIKANFPECLILPDVALDPYTSHGHDGILDKNGNILNDDSVEIMAKQSIIFADAGADMLAPSDMFDGRTRSIRLALDAAGHHYIGIIAYAAKYASAFYNPFRSALGNNALKKLDKRSYQIEPSSSRQALDKILIDLNEGADIIMIKPAGHYLDIVAKARQMTNKPIAVFQVSGECAMIKIAAEAGLIDEYNAVYEQLISMRRAGADLIFTYYADLLF